MDTQTETDGSSIREWAAGLALVVMFCAFFWLGYFAGKVASTQRDPVSGTRPTTPAAERLSWRQAKSVSGR
jgi:hypothetical protein